METVIDLQALMQELERTNKHGKLVRSLKYVLLVQSCNADIEQAGLCLDRLREISTAADPDPVVQQALLTSSIIFYVRATVGSARGGRGSSQIKASLKAQLQTDHDVIKDLRNEAIAHVHIGETDDAWHQQFLALVDGGAGWRVMATSRGFTRNAEVQKALERLVPAARDIFKTRFHEAVARSASLFNESAENIELAPFARDAAIYFGDAEIAERVLQSRLPGSPTTLFF